MTQHLTARQLEFRYHTAQIDDLTEQLRHCRNAVTRMTLLNSIDWNKKQICRIDREAESADSRKVGA